MGKHIICYIDFERKDGKTGMIALQNDGSAILSTDETTERFYRNYEQAKQAIERAGYYKV